MSSSMNQLHMVSQEYSAFLLKWTIADPEGLAAVVELLQEVSETLESQIHEYEGISYSSYHEDEIPLLCNILMHALEEICPLDISPLLTCDSAVEKLQCIPKQYLLLLQTCIDQLAILFFICPTQVSTYLSTCSIARTKWEVQHICIGMDLPTTEHLPNLPFGSTLLYIANIQSNVSSSTMFAIYSRRMVDVGYISEDLISHKLGAFEYTQYESEENINLTKELEETCFKLAKKCDMVLKMFLSDIKSVEYTQELIDLIPLAIPLASTGVTSCDVACMIDAQLGVQTDTSVLFNLFLCIEVAEEETALRIIEHVYSDLKQVLPCQSIVNSKQYQPGLSTSAFILSLIETLNSGNENAMAGGLFFLIYAFNSPLPDIFDIPLSLFLDTNVTVILAILLRNQSNIKNPKLIFLTCTALSSIVSGWILFAPEKHYGEEIQEQLEAHPIVETSLDPSEISSKLASLGSELYISALDQFK